MRYSAAIPAVFLERPNRFVARVELNGGVETVHVKNTGRCRELLLPGSRVILVPGDNPARKTKYDLTAVYKGDVLVNMDSQAPNAAAGELLMKLFPACAVHPERRYVNSRFDFYLEQGERRIFAEVKGVTLEKDGTAMFSDAPTERGRRHLLELAEAAEAGYEAYVLFLIQMKGCRVFTPNRETDPAFAEALAQVRDRGVGILCYDCLVTEDSMTADRPIPVQI
jgi:sugar fermentation stimulation protein A